MNKDVPAQLKAEFRARRLAYRDAIRNGDSASIARTGFDGLHYNVERIERDCEVVAEALGCRMVIACMPDQEAKGLQASINEIQQLITDWINAAPGSRFPREAVNHERHAELYEAQFHLRPILEARNRLADLQRLYPEIVSE